MAFVDLLGSHKGVSVSTHHNIAPQTTRLSLVVVVFVRNTRGGAPPSLVTSSRVGRLFGTDMQPPQAATTTEWERSRRNQGTASAPIVTSSKRVDGLRNRSFSFSEISVSKPEGGAASKLLCGVGCPRGPFSGTRTTASSYFTFKDLVRDG